MLYLPPMTSCELFKSNFGARYLRPRYAQVYTFYMKTYTTSSGVALVIDDIIVSMQNQQFISSLQRAKVTHVTIVCGNRLYLLWRPPLQAQKCLERSSSNNQSRFMTSKLSFSRPSPPRRCCYNGKLPSTPAP